MQINKTMVLVATDVFEGLLKGAGKTAEEVANTVVKSHGDNLALTFAQKETPQILEFVANPHVETHSFSKVLLRTIHSEADDALKLAHTEMSRSSIWPTGVKQVMTRVERIQSLAHQAGPNPQTEMIGKATREILDAHKLGDYSSIRVAHETLGFIKNLTQSILV